MKSSFLYIILLTASSAMAQTSSVEYLKLGKRSFEIAVQRPDSNARRLILAFFDREDTAMDHRSFADELQWLAEDHQATVIVPQGDFAMLSMEELLLLQGSFSPEHNNRPTTFFAVGTGASYATSLINKGVSGILVAPKASLSITDVAQVQHAVYSIANTRTGDSASVILQTLSSAGAWVKETMVIADLPYLIDNHRQVYGSMIRFNDSLQEVLADSAKRTALKSEVISDLPEVIRQGKPVMIDLMLAREGKVTIALLDLSGKAIQSETNFLGKGRHAFTLTTREAEWGVYRIEVTAPGLVYKHKIMIRG